MGLLSAWTIRIFKKEGKNNYCNVEKKKNTNSTKSRLVMTQDELKKKQLGYILGENLRLGC